MITKEEILNSKDKDGIPKYWRGTDGYNHSSKEYNIKLDEKDVLKAMDEYAEVKLNNYIENKMIMENLAEIRKKEAIDYLNKMSDLLKMEANINVVARLIHLKSMIEDIKIS